MDDKSDNSGAMTPEKENEPKGKEPAPEPSGSDASATKNPALDFHADEEVSLWNETFLRES